MTNSYHDLDPDKREYYRRGDKVYRMGDPEPVPFKDTDSVPPEPIKVGAHYWHCGRCDQQWSAIEQVPCERCGDWRDPEKISNHEPEKKVNEVPFCNNGELHTFDEEACIVCGITDAELMKYAEEHTNEKITAHESDYIGIYRPGQDEFSLFSGNIDVEVSSSQEIKVGDWIGDPDGSILDAALVVETECYKSIRVYWPDTEVTNYIYDEDRLAVVKLTPDDGYEIETGLVIRDAFKGKSPGYRWAATLAGAFTYWGIHKTTSSNIRRCIGDPRRD